MRSVRPLFGEELAPARGGAEDLRQPLTEGKVSAKILQERDELVERGAELVRVGGGDVFPDLWRARRQPRAVGQPPSGKREAVLPDRVTDDRHQRARRELREMTEKR